jgi:uncharacterized membrane protein YbhN (UPF0104 family)
MTGSSTGPGGPAPERTDDSPPDGTADATGPDDAAPHDPPLPPAPPTPGHDDAALSAITAVTPDEDEFAEPDTDPVTGRPVYLQTPVPPPTARGPRREVLLVDSMTSRVRQPRDLIQLVTMVLALGLVLLLAVYARGTTLAVTEDVQDAATGLLHQIVQLPVTALEGLLTFVVPIAVLGERIWQRRWRSAVQAVVAGVLGGLLVYAALAGIEALPRTALFRSLTITSIGSAVVVLSPFMGAMSGLLVSVGPASANRVARWSWNLLLVVLVLDFIQGRQTLPGAVIAVLLGAIAGYAVRWADGATHERASGTELVRGLLRAGIDARTIVRMDRPRNVEAIAAYCVTTDAPIGYIEAATGPVPTPGAARARAQRAEQAADDARPDVTAAGGDEPGAEQAPRRKRRGLFAGLTSRRDDKARPDDDAHPGGSAQDGAAHDGEAPAAAHAGAAGAHESDAPLLGGPPQNPDTIEKDPTTDVGGLLARLGSAAHPDAGGEIAPDRQYAVWDAKGTRYDVHLLDDDRQLVGLLSSIWEAIRLRGIDRRPVTSLRSAAGRVTLMSLSASRAGVRTQELRTVTTARSSVLMVSEYVDELVPIDAVPKEDLGSDVLDDVWRQLRRAHAAGLTHRDLPADNVQVDGSGAVWLTGWERGEVASTEMSRRMDLAQALALLGAVAGPGRALASAGRALTREQMAAVAPMLQRVALPMSTRQAMRREPQLLRTMKDTLVALVPTADVPPIKLARFSVSTVVMAAVLLVIAYVLITSLNFQEVWSTLTSADPTYMSIAYVFGLLTYVGAAMSLIAFSPNPLPFGQTIVAQSAGALVALVAPAGIGPAAVNLRFLGKHRVPTPLAVASVALVQVFQFIATILLLVLVGLGTGSVGTLGLPSATVLWVIAGIAVAVGAVLAIPPVRRWVWAKTSPTLKQIGPRIMWLISSPQRLLIGVGGNLLLTACYVATFGFCLAAYGHTLPMTTLAVTYLVSNSVGALVPSPGGIGPVEAALTGGLTVAGIPPATALSVALLYRLLTMWGRVPLGWASLTYLQRRNLV